MFLNQETVIDLKGQNNDFDFIVIKTEKLCEVDEQKKPVKSINW